MTIESLEADLAAMLDPKDLPGSWTQRERADYETRRAVLGARIYAIRTATATIAGLPPLEGEQEWLDFIATVRDKLSDELLALPPHDKRTQNYRLSIQVIDKGLGVLVGSGYALTTLRLASFLREAGYVAAPPVDGELFGRLPFLGSMDEVRRRIADTEKRRSEAEALIAEALMPDDEREQLAAERAARAAKQNALPQRKVRGDGSQYDKWPDGHCVEVEATQSR